MRVRKTQQIRARLYLADRLASREHGRVSDLLREMERELPWAPSRSTFYQWVRDWRLGRERDTSGVWSLATDTTGRPDLVMRALAALVGRTRGHTDVVTVAEARWIVKVGLAVPNMVDTWDDWHLYTWALHYVEAEADPNREDRMTETDALMAVLYAGDGSHFTELTSEPPSSVEPPQEA